MIVDMTVGAGGSVALLAHLLIPSVTLSGSRTSPALFAVLRGGTEVPRAPPTGSMAEILLPLLARMGVRARLATRVHGFAARGRGEARLRLEPVPAGAQLRPLVLEARGDVESIAIRAHVARLNKEVGLREALEALQTLKRGLTKMPRVDVEQADVSAQSFGEGTWLQIRAATAGGAVLGAECVGELGKRAEAVGTEAGAQMVADLRAGACVDRNVQDQLLVFLALAAGQSRVRVSTLTPNSQNVIHVLRAFFGPDIVSVVPVAQAAADSDPAAAEHPDPHGPCTIICNGIGLRAGATHNSNINNENNTQQ